jgi:hypothetical protein
MIKKLSFKDTLSKIKTRGYWKIILEPISSLNPLFSHPSDAEKVVNESSVQLRGWDYPHIPRRVDVGEMSEILKNRTNSAVDWNHYKEAWTVFNSGQFVHVFGLREDWFDQSGWIKETSNLHKIPPMTVLDFVGVSLTLTEVMLFIKNMVSSVDYGNVVKIKVSVMNGANRDLTVIDPGRLPIFREYKTSSNELVALNKDIPVSKIKNEWKEIAFEGIVHLLKFFKDFEPPENVIREDQLRLIERRL